MKRFLAYYFLALGVCLFVSHRASAQSSSSATGTSPSQYTEALPTVDQIVSRATLASGGKTAWANITAMYIRGTVEVPAAHFTGTFESYSQAPNKTYESIMIGNVAVSKQGFDGTTAWKMTPDRRIVDMQGDELDYTVLDSDFYSEINLTQTYPQMVLQGESKIDGRSAYVVLATPVHGKPRKLYFDKSSGLRIGMSAEMTSDGKTVHAETYFDDFETVDGIQVPHTIRVTTEDVTMVFHVATVKTNIPILNWTFVKPASKAIAPASAPSGYPRVAPETEAGVEGVTGNTYTNSVFGFTYTFPAGWSTHGDATNREIMKMGKAMIAGSDPAKRAAYDASLSRTTQLLTVFQYPVGAPVKFNPSIQVIAENLDFAPGIQTGKDYLLDLEIAMKKGLIPVEFADNITELTAGGRQFFRLNGEIHFPTAIVHQVIVSTKIDQSVLSFILTGRTPEDLETLRGTLASLRFNGGSH